MERERADSRKPPFYRADLLSLYPKPGHMGQIRDRWLCLEMMSDGVLEYWSIGIYKASLARKILRWLYYIKPGVLVHLYFATALCYVMGEMFKLLPGIGKGLQYSNTPLLHKAMDRAK